MSVAQPICTMRLTWDTDHERDVRCLFKIGLLCPQVVVPQLIPYHTHTNSTCVRERKRTWQVVRHTYVTIFVQGNFFPVICCVQRSFGKISSFMNVWGASTRKPKWWRNFSRCAFRFEPVHITQIEKRKLLTMNRYSMQRTLGDSTSAKTYTLSCHKISNDSTSSIRIRAKRGFFQSHVRPQYAPKKSRRIRFGKITLACSAPCATRMWVTDYTKKDIV